MEKSSAVPARVLVAGAVLLGRALLSRALLSRALLSSALLSSALLSSALLSSALLSSGCSQRPAPVIPSERALFRDLERVVTVAAATGWHVDRLEVEDVMENALESTCRVDALDRRGLASWLDTEIRRRGGPVEAAWRTRGKELGRVGDLLVLDRVRQVLHRAEELSLDCPFWLEPAHPYRGRQISESRWQLSIGGGGKGSVMLQGGQQDVNAGGAGRFLLGRMLRSGDGIYAGVELGGSASFPRDASGARTQLELAADMVVPLVYRRTLTSAYVEVEGGWLGRSTEVDWGRLDHGVHVGVAFGARALRTRFVFPGAAFGLSYERVFVAGEDLTMIKVGGRVAFDLDL